MFFNFSPERKSTESSNLFYVATWADHRRQFNVIVNPPDLTCCVSNVKQKVAACDSITAENVAGNDVCSIVTFVWIFSVENPAS